MSVWKGMFARVRSILGPAESRMEEEFRFHVEMETERLMRLSGLDAAEARRRAMVSFGGLDTHRESMRDGRGARWFDDVGADIRYAVRGMRRSPGFAIAVAVTLGVGIGVNGLVFGYVNSLLFRPQPVKNPDALVGMFQMDTRTGAPSQLGYEDILDYDRTGVFDGIAGMSGTPLNLVVPWRQTAADMVWGEIVTENFFRVLGMRPALGRLFDESDGAQGSNPVAVISYPSWQRRYGGDSSVIGRRVRINGSEFTITGVAAKGFKGLRTFGFWPELWVPAGMHMIALPGSSQFLQGRGGGVFMTVGRLRADKSFDETVLAARQQAAQLAAAYPQTNESTGVLLLRARSGFDNPAFVKPAVLVLSSALGVFAALVTLVVICANLANLQLSRAVARIHELAVRLSLGCSRARLVRQMLIESAVLAIPGILIALACLYLGPRLEASMVPKLQFQVGFDSSADERVFVFTGVIGLAAVVLFGLIPALKVSGVESLNLLIGKRQTGTKSQRLRSVLVVSQLALSVILIVAATLFARSLRAARDADLGFNSSRTAVMSVNLGLQRYDETEGRAFYDRVIEQVRTGPGVTAAAWAFPVPFDTYGRSASLYLDGVTRGNPDGSMNVEASWVGEGFVPALGLRLENGRSFTIADSAGAGRVMIVSRQLADRLWPGVDAVGRSAKINGPGGQDITVVGVVGDAKYGTLGDGSMARVYIPLRQRYRDWQTLVVRTAGDPVAEIANIRRIIAAADPVLPVFGVGTLEQSVESGFSGSRSAAGMAAVFGAIALIISAIGLYAVVASGVSERTREIGIRVALGSTPSDVMSLVMRGGAKLGLIGVTLGLAGAFGVARTMGGLLLGLSPSDPLTFIAVPSVLAVVVLLATYIPARRATNTDPIAALKAE